MLCSICSTIVLNIVKYCHGHNQKQEEPYLVPGFDTQIWYGLAILLSVVYIQNTLHTLQNLRFVVQKIFLILTVNVYSLLPLPSSDYKLRSVLA